MSAPPIGLRALIGAILEPYADGDRIVVQGADFEIEDNATANIALLFYELATNAAKYGALSGTEGRVTVKLVEAGANARLVWEETGGPPPAPGQTAGFGSQLEKGILRALQGTIEREWRPQGLVAAIAIPARALGS